MKELKFSIFETTNGIKGAFQTTPTKSLNFTGLINYYKSEQNRELSEAILQAPTPGAKNKLKEQRAYYTPYGQFSYRNNDSLINFNSVISIDIDNLTDTDHANEIKNKLSKHKSILFSLLSVRGKGVKALMLVNATYKPADQYQQLKNIFKPYLTEFLNIDAIHIDTAQFRLSQPCYFSYDAEMYINENAAPLKLDFNYKEPERISYIPVNVPTGAKNRVDAYILAILNNKLATLTPEGSRHPKLYAVKYLGQLIHYAPHLENFILTSFIDSGVSMYGKEHMRVNVTNSVNLAYREGVNEPINSEAIESIINDLKAPNHKPITPPTPTHKNINHHTNFKYLSDDKPLFSLIKKNIESNKFIILQAPTGTGKTTLFKKLSNDVKEQIIFLAPLRTIVEQQADQYPTILGETTPEQLRIAERYPLLFSTFASAYKIGDINGKILVIDESHLLSDRSNILYSENKQLRQMMDQAKSVIFLSATTNPLLKYVLKAQQITVTTKTPKRAVQPIFYDKSTKQIDAVINHINKSSSDINVIFWNNKSQLATLQKDLIKLGFCNPKEIVKFTADTVDCNSDEYNTLINKQIIDKGVKIVLATSKIGEGVNINNTDEFNILFVGSYDANYFTQSLGRFRKCKRLNINILFSEAFRNKTGLKIDNVNLYEDLKNEIQQVPKLFNDFNSSENIDLPYINIDWKERSIIYTDAGEKIINDFEILHQIKRIEETNFNFELWKDAIQLKISNIMFNKPKDIKEKRNTQLEKTRKERKEEKLIFLQMIRERLITADAGAILYEVMHATRNRKLKGYIKELLYDFKEQNHLTINEKILFFDNYETIEKYISNIKELMTAAKLNFTDASVLFTSDDNHKPANYNNLIKRIVVNALKTKGVPTIEHAKILQSATTIEEVFKPYLKDGKAKFKKDEIFKILRQKLYYRTKTENVAVLKSKIGVLFDVEYSKFTKKFTLTKVNIQATLKPFVLIEPKQNMVNAKTHDTKGQTPKISQPIRQK